MRARIPITLGAMALGVASLVGHAAAQPVQIPGPNLRATMRAFGEAAGSNALGDALAFGPSLEIALAPIGSASGLTLEFDASTGVFVRVADTFGPVLTQRALTTGRGRASFGLSWARYDFDEIAGADLGNFVGFSSTGFRDIVPVRSDLGFDITSTTVSLFGTVGVTNRLDVGVVVPINAIKVRGEVTQEFRIGPQGFASADQSSTGIGDIAVQGKLQIWRSQATAGASLAPASALAAVVSARLPTGDEENLHGLGFARTKVGVVFSQHATRFALHANAGYEFWSEQIAFARDILESSFAKTSGSYEIAVGTEVSLAPRLTVGADVIWQTIRGAGALGLDTFEIPGILVAETVVGLEEGLQRATFVPGLRWNLFGKALVNANVIVSLKNDGLRAKVTPSVGIDWTF